MSFTFTIVNLFPILKKMPNQNLTGLDSYCRDYTNTFPVWDPRCSLCSLRDDSYSCNYMQHACAGASSSKEECQGRYGRGLCLWTEDDECVVNPVSACPARSFNWPTELVANNDLKSKACRFLKKLNFSPFVSPGEPIYDFTIKNKREILDGSFSGLDCSWEGDLGSSEFIVSQTDDTRYEVRNVWRSVPKPDQGYDIGNSCILELQPKGSPGAETIRRPWNMVYPV